MLLLLHRCLGSCWRDARQALHDSRIVPMLFMHATMVSDQIAFFSRSLPAYRPRH